MSISLAEFRNLVSEALDLLPEDIAARMENVQVVVEEIPPKEILREMGLDPRATLFGLYQGIPLTERTTDYMALPDTITIYRQPILARFRNAGEIRTQVARTVIHEVAHHFGIDDDRLRELGWG